MLGIVHLSGLARGALERGGGLTAREMVSRPLFVPETQPVDELLRELQLQRQRTSLAVVLDEYGDFAGAVAVKDIIEEIIGGIHDERGRGAAVDRLPDGRLMVRGHVPLEVLEDYDVVIEEESLTSVGGLIFTRLGRLPLAGWTINVAGWRLTVEAIRGTRIALVAIEPLPPHRAGLCRGSPTSRIWSPVKGAGTQPCGTVGDRPDARCRRTPRPS